MSNARIKRSRKAERLAKEQRRAFEATAAERRVDQNLPAVGRSK